MLAAGLSECQADQQVAPPPTLKPRALNCPYAGLPALQILVLLARSHARAFATYVYNPRARCLSVVCANSARSGRSPCLCPYLPRQPLPLATQTRRKQSKDHMPHMFPHRSSSPCAVVCPACGLHPSLQAGPSPPHCLLPLPLAAGSPRRSCPPAAAPGTRCRRWRPAPTPARRHRSDSVSRRPNPGAVRPLHRPPGVCTLQVRHARCL